MGLYCTQCSMGVCKNLPGARAHLWPYTMGNSCLSNGNLHLQNHGLKSEEAAWPRDEALGARPNFHIPGPTTFPRPVMPGGVVLWLWWFWGGPLWYQFRLAWFMCWGQACWSHRFCWLAGRNLCLSSRCSLCSVVGLACCGVPLSCAYPWPLPFIFQTVPCAAFALTAKMRHRISFSLPWSCCLGKESLQGREQQISHRSKYVCVCCNVCCDNMWQLWCWHFWKENRSTAWNYIVFIQCTKPN